MHTGTQVREPEAESHSPRDYGDGEPKREPTCAVTQRSCATSGTAKRSEPPAWMAHAGLILHSKNRVGMAGFEPAASCSQSRRANQAALHPAAVTWKNP